MTKLLKNQESRGQWVWILLIRIIGFIILIAPLYLPILAYFSADIENITLTNRDVIMACVGLFLSAGGKQIGILLNNIGMLISTFLSKLTK